MHWLRCHIYGNADRADFGLAGLEYSRFLTPVCVATHLLWLVNQNDFKSNRNHAMPFKKTESKKCLLCLLQKNFTLYPDIKQIQSELITAINILGLLVQDAQNQEIIIASEKFNPQELAVTTLNLISLEQKFNTLLEEQMSNSQK